MSDVAEELLRRRDVSQEDGVALRVHTRIQGNRRGRSPYTDMLQPGPEQTAGHNTRRKCHFLIVCYDRDGEYYVLIGQLLLYRALPPRAILGIRMKVAVN